MVYLDLSVDNYDAVMNFYSKIGIFDTMGDSRLICKSGVDLILDLVLAETEEHKETFGQSTLSPSSFRARQEGELEILDHVQTQNIACNETYNKGGRSLSFIDPSGNRFTISGYDIK